MKRWNFTVLKPSAFQLLNVVITITFFPRPPYLSPDVKCRTDTCRSHHYVIYISYYDISITRQLIIFNGFSVESSFQSHRYRQRWFLCASNNLKFVHRSLVSFQGLRFVMKPVLLRTFTFDRNNFFKLYLRLNHIYRFRTKISYSYSMAFLILCCWHCIMGQLKTKLQRNIGLFQMLSIPSLEWETIGGWSLQNSL